MSESLTPVPTCTTDPCVIGAPAPKESVCGTSGLEDPWGRVRDLELENKQLKADMRELERQIANINTSIGLLRATDELFDARITALENGTGGVDAEIDALKVRMTNTENATAQNASDIASNDTDIADIYERGLTSVTSPTEVLTGTYLDGDQVQFPNQPTESLLLDSEGNPILDEEGGGFIVPSGGDPVPE